ncbi:MAG: VOC family protein [Candidatus Bathyarchaeia archaeon]|jgi:catechol 2,3-dioxygenase-like lactoylglutathione lyase family enzyme
MRIGSVVIDCRDFDRMSTFWREALRYLPREPATEGWVVLRDPAGRGPNVSLNRDPEKPASPGPIHLDLYTDDREGEVKRLLLLGAIRHRPPELDEDFEVLADPEGNLFCIVAKPESR